MNEMPADHRYRFDYEGAQRDLCLATLRFYLRGKPDSPAWRNLFRCSGVRPVKGNGQIYPAWALLDFYALLQSHPDWETRLLPEGETRATLPALEVVLERGTQL